MDRSIVVLDRPGYPAAARVLARSLRNDPAMLSVLRGIPEAGRVRRLAGAFLALMTSGGNRLKVVGILEDARLVGAAVLYQPGAYPLPALSRLLAVGRHLLLCGAHGLGRWRQLQAAYAQHRRPEPHLRVALLGVTPEHQRQGVGGQLLQHCVDLADRANAGVVVASANPRHAALYARYGFEVDAEADAAGVAISYLWRPVQPRSGRLERAAARQDAAAQPAAAGQLVAA